MVAMTCKNRQYMAERSIIVLQKSTQRSLASTVIRALSVMRLLDEWLAIKEEMQTGFHVQAPGRKLARRFPSRL